MTLEDNNSESKDTASKGVQYSLFENVSEEVWKKSDNENILENLSDEQKRKLKRYASYLVRKHDAYRQMKKHSHVEKHSHFIDKAVLRKHTGQVLKARHTGELLTKYKGLEFVAPSCKVNMNYITGMGSVFDIYGNYFEPDFKKILKVSDNDALLSDWMAVGNDLVDAIESVNRKITKDLETENG